jgi:hypothetical protein
MSEKNSADQSNLLHFFEELSQQGNVIAGNCKMVIPEKKKMTG